MPSSGGTSVQNDSSAPSLFQAFALTAIPHERALFTACQSVLPSLKNRHTTQRKLLEKFLCSLPPVEDRGMAGAGGDAGGHGGTTMPHSFLLDHVSPATRLLEKRRQMFEIQEALEAQKEEFSRRAQHNRVQ